MIRVLRLPLIASVVVALLLLGFALGTDSPDFRGHAAGHWIESLPPLIVGSVLVRFPSMATESRRQMRVVLAGAVLLLAVGSLVEGIGAFGLGFGDVPVLHDLGALITLLAIPAIALSFVALVLVFVFSRPRRSQRKV